MSSDDSAEWKKPERYVPAPGMSDLPPQLQLEDTSPEGILKSLKELPFFMNDESDVGENGEENPQLEALRAMSYEGEPEEVALNFKNHGNECYQLKKYQDAIQYYERALDQHCKVDEINVACYINRAACNLELKNYRRCFNDCKKALEIDPKNAKALYRSAKAYIAVDRLDEAKSVLNYGLAIDPDNKALQVLSRQEEEKRSRQEQVKAAKLKREQDKQKRKRNLEMALKAKNICQMFSIQGGYSSEKSADLGKVFLEDVADPSSSVYFTLLFLYPVELESDMFEKVSEGTTLAESIKQLFENPPPWFERNPSHFEDYTTSNVDAFLQTSSGGLAKVGKKSTILKVLSMETPRIPLIDDTVRVFIVPKNKQKEWLATWSKDQALRLLHEE